MGITFQETNNEIVIEKDGSKHIQVYDLDNDHLLASIDEDTRVVSFPGGFNSFANSAYFNIYKDGSTFRAIKYTGEEVSSSSDASTVLQYCQDNVPVTGSVYGSGAKIHIGPGVYPISSAISWTNREVIWEGEGWSTCLQTESTSGANIFEMSGSTCAYGGLYNLWLDGNSESVNCLDISADADMPDLYIDKVLMAHADKGIDYQQTSTNHPGKWHLHLTNNVIEHMTRPIDVIANFTTLFMINNEIKINTEATRISGYSTSDRMRTGIISGNIFHADNHGCRIINSHSLNIIGNFFRGDNSGDTNQYSGLVLEDSRDIALTGNDALYSDMFSSNLYHAYGVYIYDDCSNILLGGGNNLDGQTSAIRNNLSTQDHTGTLYG